MDKRWRWWMRGEKKKNKGVIFENNNCRFMNQLICEASLIAPLLIGRFILLTEFPRIWKCLSKRWGCSSSKANNIHPWISFSTNDVLCALTWQLIAKARTDLTPLDSFPLRYICDLRWIVTSGIGDAYFGNTKPFCLHQFDLERSIRFSTIWFNSSSSWNYKWIGVFLGCECVRLKMIIWKILFVDSHFRYF